MATGATAIPPDDSTKPSLTADGALLEQFIQDRNEDAFAAIVHRHGPYILAVCRHLTSHVQDAEDVFQACFLELVRKAGSIRRTNSVAGWLHTVAVRLARKARTRRATRERRETASPVLDPAAPAVDLSWRDACRVLHEELAQLPEELRLPILLCLFEGLTQEEAGQALDVNPRTLKDRLRRGRELLRDRLVRRGVTLAVLGTLLTATNLQAALPAALTQTTLASATSVATHAPLAGVAPSAVLGLTTSSAGIAGWIGLAAAIVVAALTTATGAYVVWDHWAAPPEVAPAPIAAEAPPPAKSAAPTAPRTLRRSFRNKQFDAELFQWSGPNYKKYVRLEDEGLRITLPAKDGPGDCVGLKLRYPVHGDFDVEATLEFIDVARPERPRGPFGWGAGVTVYFFMDSRDRDGFWVGKLHEREQGPIFSMGHRVKEGADRVNKSSKVVQSVHPDGFARVRAVRKGATFQSFYAEGERGEFQPLSTTVVSDADAIVVRFAADPVWIVNIALDVRLIDFAITADKIVGYEP